MSRGITRERQVRALLEANDYWVCRAAGSLGDADLVALKKGERLLVEVKSSTAGPYHDFGPKDRAGLLFAAEARRLPGRPLLVAETGQTRLDLPPELAGTTESCVVKLLHSGPNLVTMRRS